MDDVCKEMTSLADNLHNTADPISCPIQQLERIADIQRLLSTSMTLLMENSSEFNHMDQPLRKLLSFEGFGVQPGWVE